MKLLQRLRDFCLRRSLRFLNKQGICLHSYIIISAQQLEWPEGVIVSQPLGTVVLIRCACGKHETFVLVGKWDLPTLLRSKSECAEFDALVQK